MDHRKRLWLGSGILAVAGLFVYGPALRGEWVWDDPVEIGQNEVIRGADGWWRVWVAPASPDYFPLKSFLQWIEWQLWGDETLGYHLVSLAFHVLAAFLIWRLVARFANERAGFLAGLIFVVHPLAVESVAWISELKNVMSLAFVLAAFGAYIDGWHRRSLGWFTAAMLCKTSVAMFPGVLLLYAWWKRGRVGREDWRAAAPFFGVSAALGLVTVWFQWERAIAGIELHLGGGWWRVGSAGMAIAFYFLKSVLPLGLMPNYPNWGPHPVWFQPVVCWTLVLAGLGWLWRRRGEALGRNGLFGVGFFLINLAPVLGFVPMSYMKISRVADHLAYLPLVGIVALAACWLATARPACPGVAWRRRAVGPYLVVVVLAVMARGYAEKYHDGVRFWSFVVERNPGSAEGQNNYGNELMHVGRAAEAEAHFELSVKANPQYAEAENDWGNALLKLGHSVESIPHFVRAVQLKPKYPEAYCNWGDALVQIGRYPEAMEKFNRALELKPKYGEVLSNMGLVDSSEGRLDEAIAQFKRALALQPDLAEAWLNLGLAYAREHRGAEAMAQYRKALRLNPNFAEAHNNLANELLRAGRAREAVVEYEAALRIVPNYREARANLAEAQKQLAGLGGASTNPKP